MNYKDLIRNLKDNTSLTHKELNKVMRQFGIFIKVSAKMKIPFKWKGVMNVTFITTKESKRVLNGKEVLVPSKVKPKVKLCV